MSAGCFKRSNASNEDLAAPRVRREGSSQCKMPSKERFTANGQVWAHRVKCQRIEEKATREEDIAQPRTTVSEVVAPCVAGSSTPAVTRRRAQRLLAQGKFLESPIAFAIPRRAPAAHYHWAHSVVAMWSHRYTDVVVDR